MLYEIIYLEKLGENELKIQNKERNRRQRNKYNLNGYDAHRNAENVYRFVLLLIWKLRRQKF